MGDVSGGVAGEPGCDLVHLFSRAAFPLRFCHQQRIELCKGHLSDIHTGMTAPPRFLLPSYHTRFCLAIQQSKGKRFPGFPASFESSHRVWIPYAGSPWPLGNDAVICLFGWNFMCVQISCMFFKTEVPFFQTLR